MDTTNHKASLFQYINAHLDGGGRYTETFLPDVKEVALSYPLGAQDAFFYTQAKEDDTEGAAAIAASLERCLAEPGRARKKELYALVRRRLVISICKPLAANFKPLDRQASEKLLLLAREFFYQARHREPLKFAIILFGLYGMQRLKLENPVVWHDLVNTARCEEFTFFFFFSCRKSGFMPQSEVWSLVTSTRSWGKAYAVTEARCRDAGERRWLFRHAYDIDVPYPAMSAHVIRETRLTEILAQQSLSDADYHAVAVLLFNFLGLVKDSDPEKIQPALNTVNYPLAALLEAFLRHSQPERLAKPQSLLALAGLRHALEALGENRVWLLLTERELQLLLARFDALLYNCDLQALFKRRLFSGGKVNYVLCNLAVVLDVDIWPRLYAYYRRHPAEYGLLEYLLSSWETRAARTLKLLSRNLKYYLGSSEALLLPLHYLRTHPGQGEAIVCAALTSFHDITRMAAVTVLGEWPAPYSPAICDALTRAQALSQTPELAEQIAALLAERAAIAK